MTSEAESEVYGMDLGHMKDKSRLGAQLREDRVRAATLEVLAAIREEGQLADRALGRVLRRERGLWSGERKVVAERVYGLLRNEQLVEAVLARAVAAGRGRTVASLSASEADGARLAIWAALCEDGTAGRPESFPSLGVPQGRLPALRDELLAEAVDPWDRLALTSSLPRWFVAALGERLGTLEASAVLASLNQRAPLTVRANLLKGEPSRLGERLAAEGSSAKRCAFSPWGWTLDGRANAFALPAFREGLFEVQDEGSQLLALLCGTPPGRRVVDACAGAGGKTLALSAAMGSKGELWALDASADRLDLLRPRARRAGAQNLRIEAISPTGPLPRALDRLRRSADVVLVDAPCSGVGALRRNPDARRRLTVASIAEQADQQLAILRRAATLVKPGGRLVYGTCSLLWAENERVVERFLAEPSSPEGGAPENGNFETLSPAEALGGELAARLEAPLLDGPAPLRSPLGLRLWPQRHGTDGFFGALMRRLPTS